VGCAWPSRTWLQPGLALAIEPPAQLVDPPRRQAQLTGDLRLRASLHPDRGDHEPRQRNRLLPPTGVGTMSRDRTELCRELRHCRGHQRSELRKDIECLLTVVEEPACDSLRPGFTRSAVDPWQQRSCRSSSRLLGEQLARRFALSGRHRQEPRRNQPNRTCSWPPPSSKKGSVELPIPALQRRNRRGEIRSGRLFDVPPPP
jgi:hypothetical protein